MKGYWHISSIGLVIALLTIHFKSFIFVLLYFFWLFYLFYRKRLRLMPLTISSLIFLLFLFHIPEITPLDQDHELLMRRSVTGKIISAPERTKTFVRFTLEENRSKERIIYYHFYNDSGQAANNKLDEIAYGALCQIRSDLKIPQASTNPGQFDYQKYLLKQGIGLESTISSLEEINCRGLHPLHYIFSLRNKLISYTSELLSEETASWLHALVLGDDSLLSEQIIQVFNRWSLSHILAISGLHVGLILGLVYFSLVKLNLVTKERAQIFIIIFLPIYALLAGGAPSVWRASLMGLIFIVLSKFQIKYSVTDIISLIFIGLIAFDPYLIFHIGFQFSFLVTFGLLLSRKWFMQTNSRLWQVMKISFISQIIITPLQLNYFYFFQPLSIIVNTLVVPYFSLLVIPSMFLLLITSLLLPKLTLIIDQLFVFFHRIFMKGIFIFDQIFNYPWVLGEIPFIATFIYYLLTLLLMKFLEERKLLKSFYTGLSLVILLLLVSLKPHLSKEGFVTMLDIGQGDAFVIELPYRRGVIFIDAGASFSFNDFKVTDKVYSQILEPYLFSRGISKVDAVIISHEDIDHSGSVSPLVDNFSVDEVFVSKYYDFTEEEIENIRKNKTNVKRIGFNEGFTVKGLKFKALSPERDRNDKNDNSLVVISQIGAKSWLFTGDIGKEVERRIIANFKNLQVDVLKVAHHGSSTSTDQQFIRQINPQYALISAGRNNRYGHPNLEVLDTLAGRVILRTDLHGAIQYRFTGEEGYFKSYKKIKGTD